MCYVFFTSNLFTIGALNKPYRCAIRLMEPAVTPTPQVDVDQGWLKIFNYPRLSKNWKNV
jgi:hypothetical protein